MTTPSTLYHVTYLFNVPSIAEHGLVPGQGQVFAKGLQGYARGRLFLTDWDGVSFWVTRYGELAEHHTDHPEEGWIPVVLEVDADDLDLHVDAPGTKDSGGRSFYTNWSVPPESVLSFWDGNSWEPLGNFDSDEMLEQALAAADTEEVEDEVDKWGQEYAGGTLYYMDYDVFLPETKP